MGDTQRMYSKTKTPTLQRQIGLTVLTLYGLGTTIGAGIYVIIGVAAGHAGYHTPLAFILAGIIAGLTAASFAELSVRYPVSAGEAAYIEAGLGLKNLSLLIGLAIAASGAVSSATLLQGGVGYLQEIVRAPDMLLFLALLIPLAALATWSVSHSLLLAAALTFVEIAGLVIIIVYAPADPISLTFNVVSKAPPLDIGIIGGLSTAILLAFFAFIGFEDMVNVVEEVREPERNLPRAIFLTLAITMVFYVWIALIAVSVLSPSELEASKAPLAKLFQATAGGGEWVLSLIAITAVLNGVIIQLVMSSRVLYGLSRMGHLPALLGAVSPVTHTPIAATMAVCVVITILGSTLQLNSLATTTSSLTLAAFALVNLSLWRIKIKNALSGVFSVPLIVPVLGFFLSGGFLAFETARRLFGTG